MDHSLLLPGLTLVAAAAALLSMVAGFDSSALASSGEVGGGFRIRKLEVSGKSGETIIEGAGATPDAESKGGVTMTSFMLKHNAHCYALMRIIAGFLFLWHGSQKLFDFPSGMPPGVPAYITYVAGPIELIGGILIMIGLFTRHAAFLTSGLMAFAYWIAHGTKALLPIQNSGELAALYCFVFLFISTQGGGIWSVDALRKRH